jgi:hypothetical protein
MNTDIAIIGAGPWGLAVLDRLVMTAHKRSDQHFCVSVIDPDEPGPGVHKPGQPEHLLLNTVAGQIDSFSATHFGEPPLRGALPFVDWLHAVKQWPADAEGFVPRALFGAYLRQVFEVLRDNAPRNLELAVRRDVARDLSLAERGRVRIALGSGAALTVDRAFVCTGHGLHDEHVTRGPAPLPPYPMEALQARIEPGAAVGISGMGLVAVDVVASLTEGRGGRFERERDDTLRYLPSGREPVMFVFSRSGTPFACRPCAPLDSTGAYAPRFCTPAYLAERRLVRCGALQLEDLIGALCDEMRAAHLSRSGGVPQVFDPESLLQPAGDLRYRSGHEFPSAFAARLAFDVAEAKQGEAASPYKFAVELLRVLRGFIRQACDAMAPAARQQFFERVAPRIAQLVVGPPVLRGEQWLALMRAGLLRTDLGPSPTVSRDHARGVWRAQSAAFDSPLACCLDHLVRGQAAEPALRRDGASLLSALYRSGLCAATARDDECETLLPHIDHEGHPIDAIGRSVNPVTVLGVPTEGVSYFNHYLPSPKSRAAAFERIQAAIDRLLPQRSDAPQRLQAMAV